MKINNVKRFILADPSTFKVVGFLVGTPQINMITGEENVAINCRIGNLEKPVDISPFLENVKVVN